MTLTRLTSGRLPGDHSAGRMREYAKGSYVWSALTVDHNIYFLERGQVAIMLSDETGCEVIIRVVEPGEVFGELCFCSAREKPRSNCAQTTVDSRVLEVTFDNFINYLQRDPSALKAFTFTMCERLADAESRIEVLSHRGATARLGRLLIQLASRGTGVSSSPQENVRLSISHDDLARMSAMTRPHVSITMGKLRDRGLVKYDRGSRLMVHVKLLQDYLSRGE